MKFEFNNDILKLSNSKMSGRELLEVIKTNNFILKTIKKTMNVTKLTRLTVEIYNDYIKIVKVGKLPCQFCGKMIYTRSPFPVCNECWKENKFDEMEGDISIKEYNLF